MLPLPDQKCVDLANHFLPDADHDRVWRLALAFQDVAEEFLDVPLEVRCPYVCPKHGTRYRHACGACHDEGLLSGEELISALMENMVQHDIAK